MTDASDYMSGITHVGDQDQTNDNNTYQVRGFRQNKPYRNGIREPSPSMLFDSATMDRVEVLKGPSSLLSGVVEAGGMMNSISKVPGTKQAASLSLRGDNWGMVRGDADVTMPLTKRLSSRFVLVRRDGTQTPLAPLYDGPYRVLERSNHFFRLQIGERTDNVSTLRLKAANTPADTVPAAPPRRGRPPTRPPPPDPPRPTAAIRDRPARPRSERHVTFLLPSHRHRTPLSDTGRPSRTVRPPVRLNP
jgi:outer membrane receptor protein involved in Fe transport